MGLSLFQVSIASEQTAGDNTPGLSVPVLNQRLIGKSCTRLLATALNIRSERLDS